MKCSTLEMLRIIHVADQEAVEAVERELPRIAARWMRLRRGSRRGAAVLPGCGDVGTAGGAGCVGVPAELQHAAGTGAGDHRGRGRALRRSIEQAEDNPSLGARDLEEHDFGAGDVLVGIAASGRTRMCWADWSTRGTGRADDWADVVRGRRLRPRQRWRLCLDGA